MISIKIFEFNPLMVNAFILFDETKECILIDPSCYEEHEKKELSEFIEENELRPVMILNTHAHFDHIMGNKYCREKYNIKIGLNENDLFLYKGSSDSAQLFGMSVDDQPNPDFYVNDKELIKFGNSEITAFLSPGHSPGSLVFGNTEQKIIISGDVLFRGSVGRTDLPGGNMSTLIESINKNLMILPDDTKVFPGHGPETNIGFERKMNPFINGAY